MTRTYQTQGLCPVCHRYVQARNDRLLVGHKSERNRSSRMMCDGSGREPIEAPERDGWSDPVTHDWEALTPAQRFNATEEWNLVNALVRDYDGMVEGGVPWWVPVATRAPQGRLEACSG
jgi:hypothetical protein